MTSKKTKAKRDALRNNHNAGKGMTSEQWNEYVHGIEPPSEEEKKAAAELELKWPSMTNKEKLLMRPVEKDTQLSGELLVDFGEFKGLFEKWSWDGISGQSVIILAKDLDRFKTEKQCRNFIFKTMELPIDPQATLKVSGKYFFINFHFSTED